MIDYSTPLNREQIATAALLGATLFTDKNTGHTYISKRYFNGITQEHRDALVSALGRHE